MRWLKRRSRVIRWTRRVALCGALIACGSRTGLDLDGTYYEGADGGSSDGQDGSVTRRDGSTTDALPPIDGSKPDGNVVRNDCPDADATFTYVIDQNNELYSFDPAAASFTEIGVIACPAPPQSNPFSMAVDRNGVAYVVFSDMTDAINDGLYRVSTLTAACVATSFQAGGKTFGMGFSTDNLGPTETLFVSTDTGANDLSGFGTVSTTTFAESTAAGITPTVFGAELTGTGDGRLFAYYNKVGGQAGTSGPSFIGQIDKTSGAIIAENLVPGVQQGNGWAFGFWGGDFYLFTAPGNDSIVTRFSPSDGSVTQVATLAGSLIVGAGVSTCAPQQ